jgi:parallel beta-helix repeat protein
VSSADIADRLYQGNVVRYVLLALVVVGIGLAGGAFITDVDSSDPDPVQFSETTRFGMAAEDRSWLNERNLTAPRVQVYYSQYQYVVGYDGIEHAMTALQRAGHTRQFGVPLAIYVNDFGETNKIELTEDGYIAAAEPIANEWIQADSAVYVVDSRARTPSGETAVPFADRERAQGFVDEFGGEILTWGQLQEYSFAVPGAQAVREGVSNLRRTGDERASGVASLLERDVTVEVGEQNARTIHAAIDAAGPGDAVRIPQGTYEETITIDKPITLLGQNATVVGDGNGSVIHVESDDVAISGVRISGVGTDTRADADVQTEDGEWDEQVDAAYGYSDAGIVAANVNRTYVSDVVIDTPTSGILVRDANGVVVENVRINGTEEWLDGFMGVLSIRSPVVVQNSTFQGGRDGVYLHRAHGSVIRDNTFFGGRFGAHLMYTSDSLVADNVARGQDTAGITIMTTPTRNAVVGNDVRNATDGIVPGGTRSYIANNIVAHNDRGLTTSATESLYENNVIFQNDVGISTGTIRPTNWVTSNDFVGNDVHVEAGVGPLRIWTYNGVGNYWDGAVTPGQAVPRSYTPTDPIEAQIHKNGVFRTLADSPAARALSAIRDTSPGLREGDVVDTAPLPRPDNPDVLAALQDDPGTDVVARVGDSDE